MLNHHPIGDKAENKPTEQISRKGILFSRQVTIPISIFVLFPVLNKAIADRILDGIPKLNATLFCVPVGIIPIIAFFPSIALATVDIIAITTANHEHIYALF